MESLEDTGKVQLILSHVFMEFLKSITRSV